MTNCGAESTREPVANWKEANERGDAAAALRSLSPEVELISPLTARYTFNGREQLNDVLTSAFEVISDISFHTDLGDATARALFYRGRVAGVELEEAQLLRLDDDGLIRELTLFGRPLHALTSVMADIGPRIFRRQGQDRVASFAGAAIAPLSFLTRLGEQYLAPLADPSRARGRR